MEKSIVELIKQESPKCPLTDKQIALSLNIKREEVTFARARLNIANSRERRKPYLKECIKIIIEKEGVLASREICKLVNIEGYNVSRHIVSELISEIGNMNSEAILQATHDVFEKYIGFNGSIKNQISQIKAAVLYPPRGLHTLISGPAGVGKSCLAEAMYRYAIESGRLSKDAPFVVFNCADYADNPQLLTSQLFGHVKGAFTDANNSKEGLVAKADQGILFLDEVHRLPPEGQELLFLLMDKGCYRKLGETEGVRLANIMIVAATTENLESSLLPTFRRRIPMQIELPGLQMRPLVERYHLIKLFYNLESERIGIEIKLYQEAIRALLLYDCPGNIGQLLSDIQVSCARAYLTYIACTDKQKKLEVGLAELSEHTQKGLLTKHQRYYEVENFLNKDYIILKGSQNEHLPESEESEYNLPQVIYKFIDEQFLRLQGKGLSLDEINDILGKQLELRIEKLVEHLDTKKNLSRKTELMNVVGDEVLQLSEKMMEIAERHYGNISGLLFILALHVDATLKRIAEGKNIHNPKLTEIKLRYGKEYEVAKEMLSHAQVITGSIMPDDEAGFIALYLHHFTHQDNFQKRRVGIIVMTHGSVAKGIAEVANKLLGTNHIKALEMALEEQPENTLNRAIELVEQTDEGLGVLLLVDMGSLAVIGDFIARKTNSSIQVVERVDTVMVLEAGRRALMAAEQIEEIAVMVRKSDIRAEIPIKISTAKKIILTNCLTGEGSAISLKKILEKNLPYSLAHKIKIIPMRATAQDYKENIVEFNKKSTVTCIVGTLNPNIPDIPFFSLTSVIKGQAIPQIINLLNQGADSITQTSYSSDYPASNLIKSDLVFINPDCQSKIEVFDLLVNQLYAGGYVSKHFRESVFRREIMGDTLLENGVAIPHGFPEEVLIPAVGIAILEKPLRWTQDGDAKVVLLFALSEQNAESASILLSLASRGEFVALLAQCKTPKDVHNVILKNEG